MGWKHRSKMVLVVCFMPGFGGWACQLVWLPCLSGLGGALQQQTPACAFWFLLTSSPSYLPIFNLKQGGGLLVSRGLSQGTVGILRLVALPSSSSKQCWYNGQTLARNHLEEHPKLRSLILSALNYHSCLNVACCWISSPSQTVSKQSWTEQWRTKAEASQVWCAAGTAPSDSRGLDPPGMCVEFLLPGSPLLRGQQCRAQRRTRACPANTLSGKDFEDPGL